MSLGDISPAAGKANVRNNVRNNDVALWRCVPYGSDMETKTCVHLILALLSYSVLENGALNVEGSSSADVSFMVYCARSFLTVQGPPRPS